MTHDAQDENKGFAEAFYVSWAWRKCRAGFVKYKGGLCERCLKKGIINAGSKDRPLEAHHKIRLTPENIHDPSIALNWDNLELLCKDCHDEERQRADRDRRWTVEPDGRVVIAPLSNPPTRTAAGPG